MIDETDNLPNILYISDVPVELSFAGATLVYRLLEQYPKDKLLIVQGMEFNPNGRLSDVRYIIWKSTFLDRLKITRLRPWLYWLMVLNELWRVRRISKRIKPFHPDVIVTITSRLMWLQAFKLSKSLKLPLHLILHDDWLTVEKYDYMQNYLVKEFREMYRVAAGRYCISPNMEKYYNTLFGAQGSVVYPMRGMYDKVYDVQTSVRRGRRIRFCYAGTLESGGFPFMLNKLSEAIESLDAELHVFTNVGIETLKDYDSLTKAHVTFYKLFNPTELMLKMNEEMDVGIVLNSFVHEEAFRYNFSSKIVDYTSSGLAVLFWGPESAGLISWAIESNYDAVITDQEPETLYNILSRLKNDGFRKSLAAKLSALGKIDFGFHKNYKVFIDRLYFKK